MRVPIVAVAGILAACAPVTDLTGPDILFGVSSAGAAQASGPVVLANNRVLIVSGVIVTPNPCHQLHGSAELKGQNLSIFIRTTVSEGPCLAVLAAYRYQARVVMPVEGPYEISVWYGARSRAGQRWHLTNVHGDR